MIVKIENRMNQSYNEAQKKVKKIKGFYIHLIIFTVMNTFIIVNVYISKNYNNENFWELESFFTLFAWGIGLLIHGLSIFSFSFLWGKDWEERKIKKLMDKDNH